MTLLLFTVNILTNGRLSDLWNLRFSRGVRSSHKQDSALTASSDWLPPLPKKQNSFKNDLRAE